MKTTTTATAALAAALLTALLVPTAPATAVPPTEVAGASCEAGVCRWEAPTDVQAPQTFVVPDGVTGLVVDLAGSKGDNRADHVGGPGGALRAVVPVTPGETLTLQVPRWARDYVPEVVSRYNGQTVMHSGNDGAYVFRGAGASAKPLVAVGGGGAAGTAGDGGAGGGWSDLSDQLLRGRNGTGPGAGGGATPTAGGSPYAGGVQAGAAGSGPVVRPGDFGLGGHVWEHHWVSFNGRNIVNHYLKGAAGGHGYYGGASGAFTQNESLGGAGGGSGHLAQGVVPLPPAQETIDASRTVLGRVALQWSYTVPFTPVIEFNGRVVDPAQLPSRTFDVVVRDLPAGSLVAVTALPGWHTTERANVGSDGVARVRYELPREVDTAWLQVTLHQDGRAVGSSRIDVVPPARGSSAGGVSTPRR